MQTGTHCLRFAINNSIGHDAASIAVLGNQGIGGFYSTSHLLRMLHSLGNRVGIHHVRNPENRTLQELIREKELQNYKHGLVYGANHFCAYRTTLNGAGFVIDSIPANGVSGHVNVTPVSMWRRRPEELYLFCTVLRNGKKGVEGHPPADRSSIVQAVSLASAFS